MTYRTEATARTAAVARTGATARNVIGAYRYPVDFKDLGISHYWDFRTAKLGTNEARVQDLAGGLNMLFSGTTALATVYTNGGYQTDLERNNSDYYRTIARVLQNGMTAFTAFMWVNRESVSSVQNLLNHFETATANRSFKTTMLASNFLELQLSQDGTASTGTYTTSETFTENVNYHFLRFNYDLTNRGQIFVDEVAQTVGMSGSHPTSIFSGPVPVLFGAQTPSAPTSHFDGLEGIVGICLNKSLSTAEGAYLYNTTNKLAGYV